MSGEGDVLCDGIFSSSGSGYAEYFEWDDGNPNAEDRIGVAVVIEESKIRPASKTDSKRDIVGAVTGFPVIAGAAAELKWHKRYLRDDRNLPLFEHHQRGRSRDWGADESDSLERRMLNPDFKPANRYLPRSQRKEWAPVCLLGRVRLRRGQPKGKGWVKLREVSKTFSEYLVK